MLSISAMTGMGLGSYYLNLAREDYYLGGGEPPGHWLGKGAEGMHLEGKVERLALRNLLLGRTPDGKRDLVQNAGKESRQCGWDLTFSAPKSVSTLFATSADDVRAKIRAAQAKAVAEALAFLVSAVTQIDPSWVEMKGFKMTHPEWGYGRLFAERETVRMDGRHGQPTHGARARDHTFAGPTGLENPPDCPGIRHQSQYRAAVRAADERRRQCRCSGEREWQPGSN